VKRKYGPPLIARNSWSWIRKVAENAGSVGALPVRVTSTTEESSKTDV
jgi:hypothetical protein